MTLKYLVAGGILCAATMAVLPAAAMPVDNLARATLANVEQVHWVCGRYRCWWRPNYYYGPRFYAAPRVYWGPRYRYRAWRRW
jgi:hypothetical protein